MRSEYCFVLLYLVARISCGTELNCRDNDNAPVDWWYIYKPPVNDIPYIFEDRDFVFITPETHGRWQVSETPITPDSMLQHTLSPMLRPSSAAQLAVAAYETPNGSREEDKRYATGILVANEKGGIWIGHTVPGLLDFNKNLVTFPQNESKNGHLLSCLSLDLTAMNELASTIRVMAPRYIRVKVPISVKSHLPAWNLLDRVGWKGYQMLPKGTTNREVLEFVTRNQSLRAMVLARRPGDRKCLYKRFAQKNNLVLDVYGHKEQTKAICTDEYSVRIIDSISVKHIEFVYYINKILDASSWAVSTSAHWQRGGEGVRYWSCVSAGDDVTGGLLVCAHHYDLWLSFDNLKVKEPEC